MHLELLCLCIEILKLHLYGLLGLDIESFLDRTLFSLAFLVLFTLKFLRK